MGTSRDEAAIAQLRAEGFEAYRFSREAPLPDAAQLLAQATHLVSSVPPDEGGDPVLGMCGAELAAGEFSWIGYLSTTGVYGDHGGELVDEDAQLAPSGERGRRRVAAETRWHTLRAHIFRLAGIYGPGRSATDQLRAGTARRIRKPGHLFSRIHVDDVVQVLRASMVRPDPGTIYNVADDDPAPAEEVVAYAAGLMGLAPPPLIDFEQAPLSEMARSFYADNKRIANGRIKERLGVRLRYPSYRQGLRSLLRV